MLNESNRRSLATLLLAGVFLATGCSDDLVGPSLQSPEVRPGQRPQPEALDPDVQPPRPAKRLDRDLAIVRVEDSGTGRITVTVRNEGPSHYWGVFEVGLYRSYGAYSALVQTVAWGDARTLLVPGATITLTLQRESCGGSMRYFVVVDPFDQVVESHEDNNRSATFYSWGCS